MLLSFSFFACDAKVDIKVKSDDSGQVFLNLQLDPMLTQYVYDLQSSFTNMTPDQAKGFIQPEAIEAAFAESKSVKLVSAEVPDANTIRIQLAFNALEEILNEGNANIEKTQQDQIREVMDFVIGKDGVKKIHFQLDKEKFNTLLTLVPAEYQAMVAAFAPPGYEVEKSDYLEMLALNFIEYDMDYMKNKIQTAKLQLNFQIDGTILSHQGGTKKGNVVSYEIPLLDLLVMSDSYYFEVQFK